MTIQEAKQLIAYIAAAYPKYYASVSRQAFDSQAAVWRDVLDDYSYEVAQAGAKGYIAANYSGFPPTPGQIVEYAHMIANPGDKSGAEAWALVRRAVNVPWDQMEASFSVLPEAVQRAVGNAASLKELAQMDISTFETVAQSNFLRMYRDAVLKADTKQKIPTAALGMQERVRIELNRRSMEPAGQNAAQALPPVSTQKSEGTPAPEAAIERLRRRLA